MSNNGREAIRYSAVDYSGRLDCSTFVPKVNPIYDENHYNNYGFKCQKVTEDIKHMLNSKLLYDINGYCLSGDRSGQMGYTFNDCRDASHQLRLYRRFHSIENDRKEQSIDLLNSITESLSNSNQLLTDISVKIEKSGGTQSQLLRTIVDTFTNSNTISQSIDSNVKTISDLELKPSTKELSDSSKSESIINLMIENKSLFEKTLIQLNDKQLASVLQNEKNSLLIESKLNDLKLQFNETKQELQESKQESQELKQELKELKKEIQEPKLELKESKQELKELKKEIQESKQELKEIKEEMRLMREAIIDVLPNKLMDAFKIMNERFSVFNYSSDSLETPLETLNSDSD
jgi:chromosome segregation ATPase